MPENFEIKATNKESFESYKVKAQFDSLKIKKILMWIKKGKFKVIEHVTGGKATIIIGKIFKFQAYKLEQDEELAVLEEARKQMVIRNKLMKQNKLFQFYTMNYFSEFMLKKCSITP